MSTCPAGKEVCELRWIAPSEVYPRLLFPREDHWNCIHGDPPDNLVHHADADGTPCDEGCKIEAQANRGYNRLTHGVDSPHHITRNTRENPEPVGEDKIPLDAEALAGLAELTGWESVGRAALKTVGQQDATICSLQDENTRLRKYARHKNSCGYLEEPGCTCGFEAALHPKERRKAKE